MTLVITDSFDRADNAASLGVADSGQPWVPRPGFTYPAFGSVASVMGVVGSKAYAPPSGGGPGLHNLNQATIDHTSPDVVAGVDIDTPFDEGEGASLTFRYYAPGEFWQATLFRSALSSNYSVFLRVYTGGGGFSTPAAAYVGGPALAGVQRIEVAASFSAIAMSVNGVELLNITSSTYSDATDHGVSVYFGTSPRLNNYNAVATPRVGGWVVGAVAL